MDVKKALEIADTLVFRQTGRYLSDLERLIFQASWSDKRQSYEEMAQTHGYSANYLKQDVGPKLWLLLSNVCGEKVKKNNLRAALERQLDWQGTEEAKDSALVESEPAHPNLTEQILLSSPVSKPPSGRDWGEAPDVSIFYDRADELNLLQKWIVGEGVHIVALLGMGGMGKTCLSVKLAQEIQGDFDWLIWRALTPTVLLPQFLLNILEVLSHGQEIDVPMGVEDKISCLIDYFKQHRCLLVLDNFETIMAGGIETGHYKQGFEDYGYLLKRIGEGPHPSCLVITSREKPQELALLEGETLPVRSLKLNGLTASASLNLLQLKGCYSQEETDSLRLIEKYNGNPLALKIVAALIRELFNGNITEFIQENTFIFDEIYLLLEEQFTRLSELEKIFLVWIAFNQEPLGIADLKSYIFPKISQKALLSTLKSLLHRCLIEKNQTNFSLQPVIKEYVIYKLIEEIAKEIETGKVKILNCHALLNAQGKEYIRKTQIQLVIKPLIEKLLSIYEAPDKLTEQLREILYRWQQEFPGKPGYLAGNILNIFCYLQVDLTGYDLSHLSLWSSYLQESYLQGVNFTNSDLSKSVFVKQLTAILSLAYSPDGQLIATGDVNGEIHLWQVADGQLLFNCKGHAGWVHDLAFSPDGQILSSASSDHTVKIWSVSDGSCRQTLTDNQERVRSVAFHPDDTILASGGSDSIIRLWRLSDAQCFKKLTGHGNTIWSVAFSPDGTIVASASEDRTIKIWSTETGECFHTFLGHDRWVRTVAFSPDGQLLASGSGDRTVKIWDLERGQCLHTLEGHTQRLRSVAFSPQGNILASGGGDHTIRLWDIKQGKCLKTLHGHSSRLTSVVFSPDGKILASGGEDRAVRLWEVKTGQCLQTWQGYGTWIQSVAFSPDGQTLASGSEDCAIRLWGLTDYQFRKLEGHTGWVCSVAFSPKGTLMASGSSDYSVRLWDIRTGQCLKTFLGHLRWIRAITFSPDGMTLASCSGDRTVKLWDVVTGQCLKTLQGHTGWLWSVQFSPDGLRLVSGSEDQTIKVWDVGTGECLQTLTGHNGWVLAVAFSPEGNRIASGSCDGTIKLWDVTGAKCGKTLVGHYSWVQSIAFSPGGNLLASGSCDETVKLWDLSSGKCLQTLVGHENWVWSVTFSPDGQILASGGQDETIKLWRVNDGSCFATLRTQRPYEGMCIKGVQGLTEAERHTLKFLGAID